MQESPLLGTMEELRESVHLQRAAEVQERLRTNPHPTLEELHFGVFLEELEPQVREAVRMMSYKGYLPQSSGFGSRTTPGDIQMIDGYFAMDQLVKNQLSQLGAEVIEEKTESGGTYTSIVLTPLNPDLEEMTDQWNRVAQVLPDRRRSAGPSTSSERFVLRFSPDNHEGLKSIVRQKLQYGQYDDRPEIEKALRAEFRDHQGPTIDAMITEMRELYTQFITERGSDAYPFD